MKMRTAVLQQLMNAGNLILAGMATLAAFPLWLLPFPQASWLGRVYGSIAWAFWPEARRTGMINLRRAYGKTLSKRQARLWSLRVLQHMGQSIAEGISFSRESKAGKSSWQEICDVEDNDLTNRVLGDPRPKIFVTAHLGSWEVATMIAGKAAGGQGAAVARHIDNPFLDAIVRKVRLDDPAQLISKIGASQTVVERIRKGDSVALLLDENGGRRGIYVDFFGRPASTHRSAALLAISEQVPVVVGVAVRRPGASRLLYKLEQIDIERFRSPEDALELTQEIVSILERWIRAYPVQWRWIHWRWKTRPDGSEETYTRKDLRECFRT